MIEFLPAQPLALVSLNRRSGIVLDVGYSETVVLPVVSLCPMPYAMKAASVGSRSIHGRISQLLHRYSPLLPSGFILEDGIDSDAESKPLLHQLDALILEDLCRQLCFVSPLGSHPEPVSKQYVPYVDRFSRLYRISREIRAHAADVLFKNEDEEMPTVVETVLASLLALPVDLRVKMAHKIILIGGVSMVRGFETRLIQELEHHVKTNAKFAALSPLSGHFELIDSPTFYQPHLPWIGASIESVIEGAHSANQLQQSDFNNGKKAIPDWTSLSSFS